MVPVPVASSPACDPVAAIPTPLQRVAVAGGVEVTSAGMASDGKVVEGLPVLPMQCGETPPDLQTSDWSASGVEEVLSRLPVEPAPGASTNVVLRGLPGQSDQGSSSPIQAHGRVVELLRAVIQDAGVESGDSSKHGRGSPSQGHASSSSHSF